MKLASILGVIALAGLTTAAPADAAGDANAPGAVFVIAFENHNFVQPTGPAPIQGIRGNPAAPFLNALVTPGNPNAAQTSYAAAYYNAGKGVHPSEANYIWAEAGSNLGVHTDADPSRAAHNLFTDEDHLTRQLDAAGIPWKNYQEDVELSSSPGRSVIGTDGPVNPYNGTTQYNYAAKHNPMAFFTDTANRNVEPLAKLWQDLDEGRTGRYNWITPDQFNDAHSPLDGGFTYHGVHYTGDQASIAAADNFLSRFLPRLMATDAYRNNGIIIIWWDESELGDDTRHTIPEIVISPLAKGNAYASQVPMTHSSDLRTMQEIFGLPTLDNPIPADEPAIGQDGYSTVGSASDLSDLFVDGAIGQPAASTTKVALH